MSVLYVTGTDTEIGKTVSSAALLASLPGAVAFYKLVQAGLEDGGGDRDVVRRLSGAASVHEGVRLAHPMAPVAAAAREGVTLPALAVHLARIEQLAATHDHLVVEGSGGLLVAFDGAGGTLADCPGPFVVVCRAGLGTLNHTALTLEALAARGRAVSGLIIGAWPPQPSPIERTNRIELARMAPLLGAIPAGAGSLDPERFRAAARTWLPGLDVT